MAFSKKEKMRPEEWFKEEIYWQLGKIIDSLNSAHSMPFHCNWLESELGLNYVAMLKEMESLLLIIWSQLNNSSILKIEHQVMMWYGKQKRSQKNILRRYYFYQEHLTAWAGSPPVQLYGLSRKWSDYILFVMTVEKNHLTKASSGIISLSEREREAISSLFLTKMQMIYNADPHQLCIDFFSLISTFTQEKISLPYHEIDDLNKTEFGTFKKFRSKLNKSDQWSLLSGIYLDVLDEITGKNNDK